MNKKAQVDTILNFIFYRLPIIIIIAAFYILVLRSYYSQLGSHELENTILIKRLMDSPNMLAYKDEITGRVYPGVIDAKKFNTEWIESNLNNNNKKIAANLELTNLESGVIEKAYVNELRARAWDDYVAIGGFDSSRLSTYVKIYKNGRYYPGLLKFNVLVKK